MANHEGEVHTNVDPDLFNAMSKEFLDLKLATTLQKRATIRTYPDWDICQERLILNWRVFIEAAIRQWFEEKRRKQLPLLKKEIVIR